MAADEIAALMCSRSQCFLELVYPDPDETETLDFRPKNASDPLADFSIGQLSFTQTGRGYVFEPGIRKVAYHALRESPSSTLICSDDGSLAFKLKGADTLTGYKVAHPRTVCMRITLAR